MHEHERWIDTKEKEAGVQGGGWIDLVDEDGMQAVWDDDQTTSSLLRGGCLRFPNGAISLRAGSTWASFRFLNFCVRPG